MRHVSISPGPWRSVRGVAVLGEALRRKCGTWRILSPQLDSGRRVSTWSDMEAFRGIPNSLSPVLGRFSSSCHASSSSLDGFSLHGGSKHPRVRFQPARPSLFWHLRKWDDNNPTCAKFFKDFLLFILRWWSQLPILPPKNWGLDDGWCILRAPGVPGRTRLQALLTGTEALWSLAACREGDWDERDKTDRTDRMKKLGVSRKKEEFLMRKPPFKAIPCFP